MKATSTINFMTWHCGLCKQKQSSTLGSKTIVYRGQRLKICAQCYADRTAREAEKNQSSSAQQ